jgi:hypothetical protein
MEQTMQTLIVERSGKGADAAAALSEARAALVQAWFETRLLAARLATRIG